MGWDGLGLIHRVANGELGDLLHLGPEDRPHRLVPEVGHQVPVLKRLTNWVDA